MIVLIEKPHFSLIYRAREDLIISNNFISLEEVINYAEQCANFTAPVIYVETDNGYVYQVTSDGKRNLEDYNKSREEISAFVDKKLNLEELEKYFKDEFNCLSIPIIRDGHILGEYSIQITDYNRLHVNVRDTMRFFGNEMLTAFQSEGFCVLCDDSLSAYLQGRNSSITVCTSIEMINQICSKATKVCDCKYGKDFAWLINSDKVEPYYDVYGRTIIHTAVSFLRHNNISFAYVSGPKKDKIDLSDDDAKDLSVHVPLNALHRHPEIIDRVYSRSGKCYSHLINGGAVKFPIYFNGVHNALGNKESDGINILNGRRITPNAPQKFQNRVFLFGACDICGNTVTDEYTVGFYLQEKFNKTFPARFRVENCGIGGRSLEYDVFAHILSTEFRQGDRVILQFYFDEKVVNWLRAESVPIYELSHLFNVGHNFGHWCLGAVAHVSYKVNKAIADFYFSSFNWDANSIGTNVSYGLSKYYIENYGLEEYIQRLLRQKQEHTNHNGAIVMNCNPMTYGHLKLIEYAASKCNWLYVFVITMDTFDFTFEQRYKMVVQSTKNFKNVTVMPSGKYFGTLLQFGEYSSKDSPGKIREIHPEKDIYIFGKYIANALNIKIRFVGEELVDAVTAQFNIILQQELPKYGVSLEIVPRFKQNGVIISAKHVRRLISEKKYDEVVKFIPPGALDIIKGEADND